MKCLFKLIVFVKFVSFYQADELVGVLATRGITTSLQSPRPLLVAAFVANLAPVTGFVHERTMSPEACFRRCEVKKEIFVVII